MSSLFRPLLAISALAAATVGLTACGTEGINLPAGEPANVKHGAQLFAERCAGCHTLNVAGTHGSAVKPNDKQFKNGPNFNVRKVAYNDILYAIRNGGFSSTWMPQDIVVGSDAEDVAAFLSKFSGKLQKPIPAP